MIKTTGKDCGRKKYESLLNAVDPCLRTPPS